MNMHIFVGGIKLDDIKPDKKLPRAEVDRIRSERVNAVLRMFDAFGEIHQRRVFCEKDAPQAHCFITFKEKHPVAKVVETMKEFEARKKQVEAAKADIESRKLSPLCVPHPSFYVRIPKQKKGKKNQNKAEGEGEVDDGGEWQEVAPAPTTAPAGNRPTIIPISARTSAPTSSPSRPSPNNTTTTTATTTATTTTTATPASPAPSSMPSSAPPPSNARGFTVKTFKPNPLAAVVDYQNFKRDPIPTAPNAFCNLEIEDDSDNESSDYVSNNSDNESN